MNGPVEAQFNVLITSLRAYHDGLIDGSFKATAFVLLVLGWLLTSKEARAYLAGSQRVRRLAALALGLGTLVYATISWRAYLFSQSVFAQLVALDYVPLSAYTDQRITAATLAAFVAQNVILTCLTCYLVLTTRSRDQGAP